jgi:hypothetical protein
VEVHGTSQNEMESKRAQCGIKASSILVFQQPARLLESARVYRKVCVRYESAQRRIMNAVYPLRGNGGSPQTFWGRCLGRLNYESSAGAETPGRRLRRHPRRDARQEHGGARPRRPVQARTRPDTSALGEGAFPGRRCAAHTRSGPTRSISTTSRTSRFPKTCWRSPSISWKTL